MKVSGIVKKHNGRGRTFGYPTANIDVPQEAEEGIFAGYTSFPKRGFTPAGVKPLKKLPSVIFIGVAGTVGETKKRLETHILDFPDRDLYGETINVELLKKLRNNQKFESVDKLIMQMRKDEATAREYFNQKV